MTKYSEQTKILRGGFFTDGTCIGVTLGDKGYVNVGATGCMDIDTFVELSRTVLRESNQLCGASKELPEESRALEIHSLRDRSQGESGATAVEYAVMLGMVIVLCVAGIGLFGTSVNDMLNNIVVQLGRFL
jgi:Flp pilus assembly pilin Flp